ncbi:helix-turn-helix transcriptional regulator [Bacillus sp. IB182487]|uniref:Helix-turn-helix transcriptional regulator n=1 Tax=Metabacillus arenae TaxID=2771434 RepID=A0A926RY15_9BACI|nr:helix-turn-helix transcriptional regulator [Metabacillus arenae]
MFNLKKGLLPLYNGVIHGYKLVKSISEKFLIADGTISPLLRRLTKEEYVEHFRMPIKRGKSEEEITTY